jgi:hypothetical protein
MLLGGWYRFAQCRVTTNLKFVKKKKAIFAEHNKAKHNKMMYACV